MSRTDACSLLRSIVVVEVIVFFLGTLFITNMQPQWMQYSVYVVGLILLSTVIIWLIVCKNNFQHYENS